MGSKTETLKERPIRAAFAIATYFKHGGLQRDCIGLARGLARRGHQVEIVAGASHDSPPDDISLTTIGAKGWSNHARNQNFARRLAAFTSVRDYDIIVGLDPLPGLDVYFAGQPVYKAFAQSAYGPFYCLTPRYRMRVSLEAAVAAPASTTFILALTDSMIDEFITQYGTPRSRFALIKPTLDEVFRKERDRESDRLSVKAECNIDHDTHICLFVGSRFHTKGLDRAMRAVHHFKVSTGNQCCLIVAGDDSGQSYRRLARKLGIDGCVKFLGGRSDIARLMTASDVLLHPPRIEATGGVLIEAMAAGLPVLCSTACGYASHVTRPGAGIAIEEPFSQDDLNKALTNILLSSGGPELSAKGVDYIRRNIPEGWREDAVEIIESLARSG